MVLEDPRSQRSQVHANCCARLRRIAAGAAGTLAAVALLTSATVAGCSELGGVNARRDRIRDEGPHVLALGNLRGGTAPSQAQIDLAMFLFGTEPESPLGLIKPAHTAANGANLLICDTAFGAIFRWLGPEEGIAQARFEPQLNRPAHITYAKSGGLLVTDVAARAVLRFGARGELLNRYALDAAGFRPAAAVEVGDAVWVSNIAQNRIDIFDAGGAYRRSFGQRGALRGQFGFPLGMALTPEGNVCVVDMLNARVQVFSPDGTWLRDIGGPGDRVGTFGRPKDVAIAPDGTVFVVDAALQRVQAFGPEGQPLLAFGQDGGTKVALSLPQGISVVEHLPPGTNPVPKGFNAAYFVLVAEQLNDPGIRVYAWEQRGEEVVSAASQPELSAPPRVNAVGTLNPHWSPEHCSTCHPGAGGRVQPIALAQVDPLCLSCHDGVKAAPEPHPIGRLAEGPDLRLPPGWPVLDGRLTCLTCHEIRLHCSRTAERTPAHGTLLRGDTPVGAIDFCKNCHIGQRSQRVNPHDQIDAQGRIDGDRCLFCHDAIPSIPKSGRRQFDPQLRVESSQLCLACHVVHWDYAPGGHLGKQVSQRVRQRMLEVERMEHPAWLEGRPAGIAEQPAAFPLNDGRIACYTCHNPHEAGLFPPGSELGSHARYLEGMTQALRADGVELCLTCHNP